jgi:pimeloyl-ACP methyl ester carboxylesterase
VGDAIADGDAVVTDLGLGEPIMAGLSLGGWAALHYAATRPCRALVCLDGPTSLDYEAMGIGPNHPGSVTDPPYVPADLASLRCPANGRPLWMRIAR